MTKTVEFILDLAAPNGYLAWYPLKEIAARTGAELVVTPVFLGGKQSALFRQCVFYSLQAVVINIQGFPVKDIIGNIEPMQYRQLSFQT